MNKEIKYTLIVGGLIMFLCLCGMFYTKHIYEESYIKVITVSAFPQTYVLNCDTCKSDTEGWLKREALYYDNIVLIDSVPKGYELDKAYYERTNTFPFWKVVVYNKVKIQ